MSRKKIKTEINNQTEPAVEATIEATIEKKIDPRNQGYDGIEDWFGRNEEFVSCSTPFAIVISFCKDFKLTPILACDMLRLSANQDPYVICNKLIKRGH